MGGVYVTIHGRATQIHEHLVDVRRVGSKVSINGAYHTGSEYCFVRDSNEELQVAAARVETPAPTTAMRLTVIVAVGVRDGTRNTNSLRTSRHTKAQ